MLFYNKSLSPSILSGIPIKDFNGIYLKPADFGIEKDFKENIVFYLFEETILTNFYGWSNSRFKDNIGINSLLGINFIKIKDNQSNTTKNGYISIENLLSNPSYSPPHRIAQNFFKDDEKTLIEESIVIPLYKRDLTEVPIIQRGFTHRSMVKDLAMEEILNELFKSDRVTLFIGVFNSIEKILESIKKIKNNPRSKIMYTCIEYPNESSYKVINFEDKWNDERHKTNNGICFSDSIDIYNHTYYDMFIGKIYTQFLKSNNETEESFPVTFRVSESGFLTSSHLVWCLLRY